jgi:acyl carrier protein
MTELSRGREAILRDLVQLLTDMTQDWDLNFSGGITGGTRLTADLGFESIDAVMLIGEIQRLYGRKDLPFERLFLVNGKYVDDVQVATVADFLTEHLARPATAGTPRETRS